MAFSTSFSFDGVESQTHITSNGDITSYTATSINPNSKEIITSYTATSINHGAEEVSFQSHTFVSDPARSFSDPFGNQPVPYTPLRALTDPSGHWDHHRQLCSRQSATETIEEKLKRLVKEFFTKGFWDKASSAGQSLVQTIISAGVTKGLKSLLSVIIRLAVKEAPDELASTIISTLGGTSSKLAPKLATVCGTVCGGVAAVIGCLFEIGLYAVDVYRTYRKLKRTSNNFKRDFGRYIVTKTTGLLASCAGAIASSLLSAIVGFLIGGWIGMGVGLGVGCVISLAAFILKKGIEWATGKTYDQIVRAMEGETKSSSSIASQGHTPGIVHFYSIDTVCVEYEDDSLYYRSSFTTHH